MELLKRARFNSILLAISFGTTTLGNLGNTSGIGILFTVIGVIATVSTIQDVLTFNKAIKEN